jgi:hypothetical protein
LNGAIIPRKAEQGLTNVGNVRSEGAIVRDSEAAIRIPTRSQVTSGCHLVTYQSIPSSTTRTTATSKKDRRAFVAEHSLSDMHKVLLVDEIVRRIAEHLLDPDDKSSSLAFSLCCRPLSDPVLDVLWELQKDLVTLFKVLPPDVWEVDDTARLVSAEP